MADNVLQIRRHVTTKERQIKSRWNGENASAGMWHFPRFLDDHFIPPSTVQMVNGLSYSTRLFFFTSTRIFFCLDSSFKISNRVGSHDIYLVFFRSWTYILQISTHVFYCIRCILQVSTYVLCFQHVFTIGIILSTTERHNLLLECHSHFSISTFPETIL